MLPVRVHIQMAGWRPKFIKSAISSRYGPTFVLPNFLAAFPSRASVMSAQRSSISDQNHEGSVAVTIQAMIHRSIPVTVIVLAIFFLRKLILASYKMIPFVIQRACKNKSYPYESSNERRHEKLIYNHACSIYQKTESNECS